MNLLLAVAASSASLSSLLIGFLILIVAIAVIAGLIYAVETWIIGAPIPPMIKLVIGLVVIVIVIIWSINHLGGG